MTPKTARERVLLVVLPALLIALIYGAKLNGFMDRRAAAAAAARTAAEKAPHPQQIAMVRQQLDAAAAKLREVQTAQQKLDGQWAALRASRSPDANRRVRAIARVTSVLTDSDLRVLDTASEEKQQDVKLPQVLQRVRKQLVQPAAPGTTASAAPPADAPLWRVRFEGRYVDVVRALDRLGKDEPLVVPVRLSMADAPLDESERSWTLWLWM